MYVRVYGVCNVLHCEVFCELICNNLHCKAQIEYIRLRECLTTYTTGHKTQQWWTFWHRFSFFGRERGVADKKRWSLQTPSASSNRESWELRLCGCCVRTKEPETQRAQSAPGLASQQVLPPTLFALERIGFLLPPKTQAIKKYWLSRIATVIASSARSVCSALTGLSAAARTLLLHTLVEGGTTRPSYPRWAPLAKREQRRPTNGWRTTKHTDFYYLLFAFNMYLNCNLNMKCNLNM